MNACGTDLQQLTDIKQLRKYDMDEQANALAVRTRKVIGLLSALKKRSVTLHATLRQIQGLYTGLLRGLRPPTWALPIY